MLLGIIPKFLIEVNRSYTKSTECSKKSTILWSKLIVLNYNVTMSSGVFHSHREVTRHYTKLHDISRNFMKSAEVTRSLPNIFHQSQLANSNKSFTNKYFEEACNTNTSASFFFLWIITKRVSLCRFMYRGFFLLYFLKYKRGD